MRSQHFSILIIAVLAGAVFSARASAAEPLPSNMIILADAEVSDGGVALSAQDFTGGVAGQNGGGDGGGMVIQMLQPTAGSAPSNAPSNFAYVRPAASGGH
jgi:hypothetical protein